MVLGPGSLVYGARYKNQEALLPYHPPDARRVGGFLGTLFLKIFFCIPGNQYFWKYICPAMCNLNYMRRNITPELSMAMYFWRSISGTFFEIYVRKYILRTRFQLYIYIYIYISKTTNPEMFLCKDLCGDLFLEIALASQHLWSSSYQKKWG